MWIICCRGFSWHWGSIQKQLDPGRGPTSVPEVPGGGSARKRQVVLIMDEAQNLGVKLLEELRLLSNLNREKSLQLQIILSGQPDLRRCSGEWT